MAELTGKSMELIVNWFMLLIIFVFDPLAIAMVVAANMAFAQIKGIAKDPKDYEVYKNKPECDIPEGLEYNKPYSIKEIEEKTKKSEVPKEKVIIKKLDEESLEYQKLKEQINHPRIQKAIQHAKRARDWNF